MCKLKTKWAPLVCSVLVGSLALWYAQPAGAACSTSSGGQIEVVGPYGGVNSDKIHVGEFATINNVGVNNLSPGSCTVTNLKAWVIYPDNTFQEFLDNVTLPNPSSIVCPGADPRCLAFSTTYKIKITDVQNTLTFTTNWPAGFVSSFFSGGAPETVQFAVAGAGLAIDPTLGTVRGNTVPQNTAVLTVLFPCVQITKNCTTNCQPIGSTIRFNGIITNCTPPVTAPGQTADLATLNIISITDNPTATITTATTTSSGRTYDGTLRFGESIAYTGSYPTGPTDCGPFSDTITVIAADVTSFRLTNSASAKCFVEEHPALTLTKDCFKVAGAPQPPVGGKILLPGDSYIETFTVRNVGDVRLVNVQISDVSTKPGVSTTITVGTLDPGVSVTKTNGPFTVTTADCPQVSDTATATGQNFCPFDPTSPCKYTTNAVSAPATCLLTVECLPRICVTKLIACAPASDNLPAGCAALPQSAYSPSAIGVAGPTNRTEFCYQVVVANCGSITLSNVTVQDNLLGTLVQFSKTFAPGQVETNFYHQSYPLGPNSSPSTNVNTVNATGTGSGIVTNAVASATAIELPIDVGCRIDLTGFVQPPLAPCQATLMSNGPVTFTLTIFNAGQADLDVVISGVPALFDCNTLAPIVVPTMVTIPVGGTNIITGCTDVTCPRTDFNVTVQGTARATVKTGVVCIFDVNGNAITTAVRSCSACANCVTPVGVQCRVTGGGILVSNNTDQSCILMVTTLSPSFSQVDNGPLLTLEKVTHGGQLGAPFDQQDCGTILGNPCIRGQWEHVRHYQGKGNPRDVVTAFHSATPKGQFDTLHCACLGCCIGDVFVPPTQGPLIKKFQLCNPTDHKICGPMPRPAPANAIIFSGIGSLIPTTDTGANNKQAVWVVFRVYIEDRSEPGGNHPGGAVEPADVYCFQAWYALDANHHMIPVSKKPNFDLIETAFRQALGTDSCAFLDSLANGGRPIGSLPDTTVFGRPADIVDQGPMLDGNHQIHPSTGATCP